MHTYSPRQLLAVAQRTGRWTCKEINGLESLYTTNLGSYLRFNIQNSRQLAIFVQDNYHPNRPGQYYAVRVDGQKWQRYPASRFPVPLALAPCAHTIELMAAGNTDFDEVWTGQQGFAITKIVADDQAVITPSRPRPLITFVGDSITAGCWVNGRHASVDYRPESNYAAICADLLNADSVRIAYSAGGVLRPATGGVPVAGKFLTHIDSRTVWHPNTPDLVVVNIGVNDRRFSTSQFDQAYLAFLQQLLTVFPTSKIMIMVPFSQTFAPEIAELAARFSRLRLLATKGWCTSYTDGTHPDQAGALQAGKHLAAALAPFLAHSV